MKTSKLGAFNRLSLPGLVALVCLFSSQPQAQALPPSLQTLAQTLQNEAQSTGLLPIAVADLDETLIDSTPRRFAAFQAVFDAHCTEDPKNAACLKGRGLNISELYSVPNRYDHKPLFLALGIAPSLLAASQQESEMVAFYLSGEFMTLDQAVPGASEFIRSLLDAGVMVFYVSSRFDDVQRAGTEAVLKRLGMLNSSPLTPEILLRKRGQSSIEFKRESFKRIVEYAQGHQGRVRLAMENEPENMNAMGEIFPEAIRVFVQGAILKPEPLRDPERVLQIPNFR